VVAEPSPPTIAWCEDRVRVIDQTQLPGRLVVRDLCSVDAVVDAIQRLVVRGAPAIGVCGALGVVIGLAGDADSVEDGRRRLDELEDRIGSARPTAVNLRWAVEQVSRAARAGGSLSEMREFALKTALDIMEKDRESCRRIGELGRRELYSARRILTHCNAGRLATAGSGTALAIVYAKASAGEPIEVLATETRPLLQGARLTAWELAEAGIPVTLVTDGMVGAALGSRSVDAVVVGCDRVAANGDTANKIGTYTCALAAKAAAVPFYVAGPISSFDPAVSTGDDITIELRDPDEVRQLAGASTAAPVPAWNPAFDVTPASLITAFVTDMGVLRPPFAASIAAAIDRAQETGWR
jgi:methylthioribose-1-phosphate isomerase